MAGTFVAGAAGTPDFAEVVCVRAGGDLLEGMNGERKKELREIIEQAPDFRLARYLWASGDAERW